MNDYNVKELLAKNKLAAKKSLGQNFITDQNLIKKMVALSKIDEQTTVIEIGPGFGILTAALAQTAKHVIACEIDKGLVGILLERFAETDNVQIISGDFMQIDIGDYLNINHDEKLAVCANLPYYLTTPILFKLFNCPLPLNYLSLMVQKEVAERFTATVNSPAYSALSLISNYKYEAKVILKVPKEVFYPQPKVDSAVVLFTKRVIEQGIDEMAFFSLIKSCFKYRRKTIYNNYKEYVGAEPARELLKGAGIAESQRAQELTLAHYLKLFKVQSESTSLR